MYLVIQLLLLRVLVPQPAGVADLARLARRAHLPPRLVQHAGQQAALLQPNLLLDALDLEVDVGQRGRARRVQRAGGRGGGRRRFACRVATRVQRDLRDVLGQVAGNIHDWLRRSPIN